MIRENPEYKLLFKRLKDVSIDELATNPKFQAHASKVGATLVSIVNFLDKPKELEKLLSSIGSRHKKYGLTPTHFQASDSWILFLYLQCIYYIFTQLLV